MRVSDSRAGFITDIHDDWRSLPQVALDAMYDQGAYAANMHDVLDSYEHQSRKVRDMVGAPMRHAYGSSAIEALDWFAGHKGGPVNIFIHGGAWRSGRSEQYHFPAATFVPAGAHFVVPDFTNVLETDGDLMPMLRQVRDAVAWVARHAVRLGADPSRISLSSHSSGSHLAACVSVTHWREHHGLPDDVIKAILYCGGIYELAPVFASSRRRYLNASDEALEHLSPLRHLDARCVPAVVAYGERETPEFIRQSKAFAAALQAGAGDATLIEGEGLNHFEILTTLGSADGLLGRAALGQMGLLGPTR